MTQDERMITGWPRTEPHQGCAKGGSWRFLFGTFYKAHYECDGCHAKKVDERESA